MDIRTLMVINKGVFVLAPTWIYLIHLVQKYISIAAPEIPHLCNDMLST